MLRNDVGDVSSVVISLSDPPPVSFTNVRLASLGPAPIGDHALGPGSAVAYLYRGGTIYQGETGTITLTAFDERIVRGTFQFHGYDTGATTDTTWADVEGEFVARRQQ